MGSRLAARLFSAALARDTRRASISHDRPDRHCSGGALRRRRGAFGRKRRSERERSGRERGARGRRCAGVRSLDRAAAERRLRRYRGDAQRPRLLGRGGRRRRVHLRRRPASSVRSRASTSRRRSSASPQRRRVAATGWSAPTVASSPSVTPTSTAPSVGSASPIVAIASTPTGRGYWLLGQDGGVFAFGDASFEGAATSFDHQAPLVGMAPTPRATATTCWAPTAACSPSATRTSTVRTIGHHISTAIAVPRNGRGYEVATIDGSIFGFGGAPSVTAGADPLARSTRSSGIAARPGRRRLARDELRAPRARGRAGAVAGRVPQVHPCARVGHGRRVPRGQLRRRLPRGVPVPAVDVEQRGPRRRAVPTSSVSIPRPPRLPTRTRSRCSCSSTRVRLRGVVAVAVCVDASRETPIAAARFREVCEGAPERAEPHRRP